MKIVDRQKEIVRMFGVVFIQIPRYSSVDSIIRNTTRLRARNSLVFVAVIVEKFYRSSRRLGVPDWASPTGRPRLGVPDWASPTDAL